jgi:hypothetical protein
MPQFINEDEEKAYYLSDATSARAAGIMWPAIVESRLELLFDIALRPDRKVRDDMFRASGALGSYGAKVQLAYLLGWIGEDVCKDLVSISKIRNRFAHSIQANDFKDQQIAAWLNNLRGSVLLPDMIKDTKAKADAETGEAEQKPPKVTAKTRLFILEGMAEDPQSRFRWCIDLIVHQLDVCAQHMRKNLENLSPNWLTGTELTPDQIRAQEKKAE